MQRRLFLANQGISALRQSSGGGIDTLAGRNGDTRRVAGADAASRTIGDAYPALIGPGRRRFRAGPVVPIGTAAAFGPLPSARPIEIGLFIPMSGAAGIWGPSCHRCADLAAHQINAAGGIGGRPVVLSIVDAGRPPNEVAASADMLMAAGRMDALIGMHISAVRVALVNTLKDRIPYIYTPLYEGGETAAGVFAIGETPNQQVRPAIRWFTETFETRRWALIGNDYIWPHVSHRAAHRYINETNGDVVEEHFIPLGREDFSESIRLIRDLKPDAVMASLVGQDLVHFNRQFVRSGLDRHIKRFCPALEENILLGLAPQAGRDLFTSGAYFGSLRSPSNMTFSSKYFDRFTTSAPVLNRFSALCYEGVLLYAEMVRAAASTAIGSLTAIAEGFTFEGPRGRRRLTGNHVTTPIYIAKANGHCLETIHALPEQFPGQ